MSGSPKYSRAELERQQKERLEAERRRKAEQEEKRRREAEERERRQQLEQRKKQLQATLKSLHQRIEMAGESLYPKDAQQLSQRCQTALKTVSGVQDQAALQPLSEDMNRIESDLNQALSRKRREDEEKKRVAELERQAFEVEELQRQLDQIPTEIAIKFDATGYQQAKTQMQAVQRTIANGRPEAVRAPLQSAITQIRAHTELVRQQHQAWQRQKASAEQSTQELNALILGLKADPVVVRWHSHSIAQLEAQRQAAEQAIAAEQFEQSTQILQSGQTKAEQMIRESNAAQLKAEQRDYITDSIAQTLEEMGFTILYRKPEHEHHPASATILGAATNSGKGISVSIPVEGQVFYDVDGFAKGTIAAVGGGSAAVCDEAEQVLTEMHSALEQQFGIQMSELTWQGKDPDRILRRADDLPSQTQRQQRGGSR